MTHLTFVTEFNSFHKMRNEALSNSDNIQIFGKCANPSGHGHRYRIEVTLGAEISSEKPFVISRTVINRLVHNVLAPRLDHKNIDIEFGPRFISSGENIAKALWELIHPELGGEVSLLSVKVVETRKNSFVYKGAAEDE